MRRTVSLTVCLVACALPWAAGCRTALGPELDAPPQPVSSFKKPTNASQTATDKVSSEFAAQRPAARDGEPFEPIQQVAAPPPSSDVMPPMEGPLLAPQTPEPLPRPSAPLVDRNAANNAPAPPDRSPANKAAAPPAPIVPPASAPATLPPPVANAPASNAAANAPVAPKALPPAVTEDPHQREAPTAYGSVLQMPPGKSPIEKALELSGRLDLCCADNAQLKERMRLLEEAIQARDRLLNSATRDFQDASAEMARVRRELEAWAQDLKQQQSRLQQQDREHQESLRNLIGLLEKVAAPDAPPPKQPLAKP